MEKCVNSSDQDITETNVGITETNVGKVAVLATLPKVQLFSWLSRVHDGSYGRNNGRNTSASNRACSLL